jgi:hypothetical protein
MRKCFRCKIEQDESNFIKNSKNRGGFMAWCEKCRDEVGLKGITEQVCKTCNIEKKISEFDRCQNKITGYDIYCKECKANKRRKDPEKAKRQMNKWLENGGRERKEIYKYNIKKENITKIISLRAGCKHCDKIATFETWCQFDLHHINESEKQFEWSRIICFKWDERHDLELPKCLLLCKCCHAQLHYDYDIKFRDTIDGFDGE